MAKTETKRAKKQTVKKKLSLDELDAIKKAEEATELAAKIEVVKKDALALIPKHSLIFIEDIVSLLPISKSTFYNYKLHESEELTEALNKQKITLKVNMRSKWYKSENASLQISLYKLIGTDEEAHRLNGSKQEIKAEVNLKSISEYNKEASERLKKTEEAVKRRNDQ